MTLVPAVLSVGEAGAAFHQGKGVTRCATSTSFRAGKGRHPKARCRRHHKPAHGGTCPNAGLTPTLHDLSKVRAATLCLVNRARAVHGDASLRTNPRLLAAAQGHTDSMAFGDYFSHTSPAGQTPLDRMRAAGYIHSSRVGFEVGENIAWATLWLATPKAIVHAWMMSPGHRANILDPRFRDTAIGVSPHPPAALSGGQPGAVYTQDFGVIVHARFAHRTDTHTARRTGARVVHRAGTHVVRGARKK
jgi:uncharacterized protein YkwD